MLTAGGGIILLFVYLLTANSYRNERVQIWLHPESHKKGFQTMQALYAIGSGGIFGKGLGRAYRRWDYSEESHNDMIFSIICEELGLFGAVCLILVFCIDLEDALDRTEYRRLIWFSDCDRFYDTYRNSCIHQYCRCNKTRFHRQEFQFTLSVM